MLNVTGAWTKAGIASCVRAQGSNKHDDFLFDCGFLNSETILSKYVFISHGHIDHVGSCISHARARSLSGSVAEYYVPHDIVKHLNDAKKAFEKLDNSTIPMTIIGVGPGDTFTFGSNMKVKVFPTCHRVPSQGYAVFVKKKGELLPEMQGLSGAEIKELKMMGQAILGPETEELQMVYTGDTTLAGLTQYDSNAFIFRARTLIIEVTYLDGEKGKAEKYGHVHIEDIVENEHLFQEVEHLVFVHLSQKYSLSRAVKLLRDQLPRSLLHKVSVSLHSFGATECLSSLTDKRWDYMQNTQAGWGWSNRNNYANNNINNSNGVNNNSSGNKYNNRLSTSSSDGNIKATNQSPPKRIGFTPGGSSTSSSANNGSVYIGANTAMSMDSMSITESVTIAYPEVVSIAPVLDVVVPAVFALPTTSNIPSSRTNNSLSSSNDPNSYNNTNNQHETFTYPNQHYNSNNPHHSSTAKKNKNKHIVARSAHSSIRHLGINRPYKQPGQVYMNKPNQSRSHKDSRDQH